MERSVTTVACRVEPVVTHPAPPQTRTCAIHAYGSSDRAAATLSQSPGLPWSGLVSSKSLPCLRPAVALPGGRLPFSGSLGSHFPTCDGTMQRYDCHLALSGSFACRSFPDTMRASAVRGIPYGLAAWWKPQDDARALGHPVPSSGHCAWRQVALPRSRATPMNPCPALRPRWCPRHSPQRVQDCCLPALANRRLSPRYTVRDILLSTTIHISGLNHAACILAHSSFVLPLLGWHVEFATDRLARL